MDILSLFGASYVVFKVFEAISDLVADSKISSSIKPEFGKASADEFLNSLNIEYRDSSHN